MKEQLEAHLNRHRNLAQLIHILHETLQPLTSISKLPTIPQLCVYNSVWFKICFTSFLFIQYYYIFFIVLPVNFVIFFIETSSASTNFYYHATMCNSSQNCVSGYVLFRTPFARKWFSEFARWSIQPF